MCNPHPTIKTLEDLFLRPSVMLADVPHGIDHEWMVFFDNRRVRNPFGRVDLVLLKGEGDQQIYRHLQLGLMGSEGNEYEAIAYYEAGGGGTVVIPFVVVEGRLHIGVLIQHRQLMGQKPVMTAAGGYKAPADVSDRQTGERELREEVTRQSVILRGFMIEGDPVNPNRAVVITAGEGEGVTFFAAEINSDYVKKVDDGYYHFVPGAGDVDPGVEKALKTVFIPVREAARSPCGFVRCGTLALIADLDLLPA